MICRVANQLQISCSSAVYRQSVTTKNATAAVEFVAQMKALGSAHACRSLCRRVILLHAPLPHHPAALLHHPAVPPATSAGAGHQVPAPHNHVPARRRRRPCSPPPCDAATTCLPVQPCASPLLQLLHHRPPTSINCLPSLCRPRNGDGRRQCSTAGQPRHMLTAGSQSLQHPTQHQYCGFPRQLGAEDVCGANRSPSPALLGPPSRLVG